MLRKAVQDRLIFQGLLWIVYAPNYHDACSSALALGGSPGPENLLVYIYRTVWFVGGPVAKQWQSWQEWLHSRQQRGHEGAQCGLPDRSSIAKLTNEHCNEQRKLDGSTAVSGVR